MHPNSLFTCFTSDQGRKRLLQSGTVLKNAAKNILTSLECPGGAEQSRCKGEKTVCGFVAKFMMIKRSVQPGGAQWLHRPGRVHCGLRRQIGLRFYAYSGRCKRPQQLLRHESDVVTDHSRNKYFKSKDTEAVVFLESFWNLVEGFYR